MVAPVKYFQYSSQPDINLSMSEYNRKPVKPQMLNTVMSHSRRERFGASNALIANSCTAYEEETQ